MKKFQVAYMDALKDDIIGGPSLDLNFCSEDKAYCFVDVLKLKNILIALTSLTLR